MYVRKKSLLCSCYSHVLLSYVLLAPLPPRVPNTYTDTVTRRNGRVGGVHCRVAHFSVNVCQHMPHAWPIKANYVKIVTIRPYL